jgi:hypothetical protein
MFRKVAERFIPKKLKQILLKWLRPWLRYSPVPAVQVRTYYPGCHIKITNPGGTWLVDTTNDDQGKISSELIKDIYGRLLEKHIAPDIILNRGFSFDFALDSVSLENWRDIHNGRIDQLIADNDDEYESEKIGAFGYLYGTTKPERLKYIDMTNNSPEKFEFIETEKYSPKMKNYLSLLDYKRKFKYVIDLPGHTYSTKSYWMLFLKRPVFYVEPNQKFAWEKRLKPWTHYIPVKRDFSDLEKHYDWAQANSDKVDLISANLYEFGINQMSPARIHEGFLCHVRKCVSSSSKRKVK